MTETEDDGFITIHPPFPVDLIEQQRESVRRWIALDPAGFGHEPELTATQVMLQQRIGAASRAYAEDVLRGLAKFMAANPGVRPVLKTSYDDETKTIHSEWTAGDST